MSNEDAPLVTQAMVCPAKGEPFELKDITLPAMKPTMVELDIEYCGLCHTDIHMRDNDWGISNYPLVAGHEGIGKVRRVGSGCRSLKVGDKVGITWIRDSCLNCNACKIGRENICTEGYQGTFLGSAAGCWGTDPHNEHGGCFSKVMRVEERFAIKLPDGLPPKVACPLTCGGGTVFEAVCNYVEPGKKVAIASIGGLGTAAIRFAMLYGGHVTALSTKEEKREAALGAGAKDFYACLGNEEEMNKLAGKFDVIIDTNPVNPDIGPYMGMLAFNGTYCKVGIPAAADMDFKYSWIPVIFTEKKIAGSIVTGTARLGEMMELAKDHLDVFGQDNDKWYTETVKMDQLNEVMDMLKNQKNDKIYRYICEW